MNVKAKRALLALLLWTLLQCQAEPQRTVADIQDLLFSPSSQQYSIYILPDSQHSENLRKRQAEYQDRSDDEDPIPEPEPSTKESANEIQRHSRARYETQDDNRDSRNIQLGLSTSYFSNSPRPSEQFIQRHSVQVNQGYNHESNGQVLPNGSQKQPNYQYQPVESYEVPLTTTSPPFFITTLDSDSQSGYNQNGELPDKMDAYTVPDESSQYYTQGSEPPVFELTTQPTYEANYDVYEPTTEYYFQEAEKAKITKKLMDKPKKVMKVIKASSDGDYVPQEVPGVMLKTLSGEEEAFVPEDLLEDAEKLVASASAQQPAYVRPDQPLSGEGSPKGMPFQFGYIVDDEATANFQTRQETGDENGVVTGCYQVLDPTGLVRTVVYRADSDGFRILSLSRGPDKIPCPGLDGATRSPITSQAPTPRPTFTNVGGFSNVNKFSSQSSNEFSSQSSQNSQSSSQFNSQNSNQYNNQNSNQFNNQNSFSQSSLSSSSSKESSSSSSQSQFNSFSGKNGLFEQSPAAKTLAPRYPPPTPPPPAVSNQYGSAQEAWMAEYLQNITKNLYSSFTNSSTLTNTNTYGVGGTNNGLVNFPFVLIPVTTFLDLQRSGAIGNDVQSYGAFIQPGQSQSQLSQLLQQQQLQRQQQEQQKQKTITETTKHTVFNTYNATKAETEQKAYRAQGVNTINYQLNGGQQLGGQGTNQVAQQQYQSQQSAQSAKSSQSSTSSSNSRYQNSFAGNQGFQGAKQAVQQQYQSQQSSKASKSSQSSSSISSSSFQGNFAGNQRPQLTYQPTQATPTPSSYGSRPNPAVPGVSYGPPPGPNPTVPRPTPETPIQPRPIVPQPAAQQPIQYRPTQPSPVQPKQIQNFAQPSLGNGASASFHSQKSQSSQESQASDSKQSFSSSSKFGNGRASQNFQSSSSKSDKASKSSDSSSSTQFSFTGAGGSAGNQHSSFSKSASSQQSSSSSSSQKSFSSLSSGGVQNSQSFFPAHLTQGHLGFPELRPSPSSLTPTYVASSPSSVNAIPKSIEYKPVSHQSYQEVTNPIVLEETEPIASSGFAVTEPTSGQEYSYLAPAPEPESGNMDGWVPITDQFSSQSALPATLNPNVEYIQHSQPAANQDAESTFHFSSSNQSSQQESSSQQSHQQYSSSWGNTGSVSSSQKQPRHLLQPQVHHNPGWGVQHHG